MTITDDRMVQMNVRIASSVKKRGDEVFAKLGYSPSAAVRALWEFAADNEGEPSVVEQFLEKLIREKDHADRMERMRKAQEEIQRLNESFISKYGPIDWSALPSDEELLEEALMEKYGAGWNS